MSGNEQYIEIKAFESDFKVWTKRLGNNEKVKILLVHGGPGGSYHTFLTFPPYMEKAGYEYIYYDQLGSYLSDNPKDPSLWTLERYVEELEQVRKALGLNKDNFFLLGQSWGGMIAMEYALKYQENLKGLIISSMQASIDDNTDYEKKVLGPQIGPDFTKKVETLEAAGDYGPDYDALMVPFYLNYVIRIPQSEWPSPIQTMLKVQNKDIYHYMYGKSEFGCTGTLQGWDIKSRLHEIRTPTLIIGSEFNTMDPSQLKWMARMMIHGDYHHCSCGSHMCHWDDQDNYFKGLLAFISRVATSQS